MVENQTMDPSYYNLDSVSLRSRCIKAGTVTSAFMELPQVSYDWLVGLQKAGRDGVVEVEVVVVEVGRPVELGVGVELVMFGWRGDVQHDHAGGVDGHREFTGVLHGGGLLHEHLVDLQ